MDEVERIQVLSEREKTDNIKAAYDKIRIDLISEAMNRYICILEKVNSVEPLLVIDFTSELMASILLYLESVFKKNNDEYEKYKVSKIITEYLTGTIEKDFETYTMSIPLGTAPGKDNNVELEETGESDE